MKNWELHCGDCLPWLESKDSGSIDLAFADPPFNVGYGYDLYDDSRPQADYLSWCEKWIGELHRVLKSSGTFWLAISDENVAELCLIAKRFGFVMRNWCIWHYTFGVHLTSKFGRSKAHLLYFVKDANSFTFNPDAVRIESERQRIGDRRANPDGRVPGDVWTDSRLCGTFKERTSHPCQMPESILRRIIASSAHARIRVTRFSIRSAEAVAVSRLR